MGTSVATVTSADGTSIAFERVGDGPPVVLVGGALNDRSFQPLVELAALLAPDFTVYTYDRRGRGDSGDTAPYAVAREVDDLEALIAEAGGSACAYGLSSGAVLALEAAARGVTITKLALFEPPLTVDDGTDSDDEEFDAQLAELIWAGRRGDAIELFMTGIGLPSEAIDGARRSPTWSGLEAMAHTILYDDAITGDRSLLTERLASVTVPTLVIASGASSPYLHDAAQAVADALPDAQLRTLEGQFHDVASKDIASVVTEFFTGLDPMLEHR
jgi:pimeloyl-ACP methyl ester carboxylesterase